MPFLLFYIIWPFGLLLRILINFRNKIPNYLFPLFGFYYGLYFVPLPNSDATRYQERLLSIRNVDLDAFWNNLVDILTFRAEGASDIYSYLLLNMVQSLGGGDRLYFALAGMIYYYVVGKVVSRLRELKTLDHSFNRYFILLTGVIFFLMPMSAGLNGLRWPLALFWFLYSVLMFIKLENWRYIGLAGISILIHFSFTFPVFVLIIYKLTKGTFGLTRASRLFVLLVGLATIRSIVPYFLQLLDSAGVLAFGDISGFVENEAFKKSRVEHMKSWNWYILFDRFSHFYFFLVFYIINLFKTSLYRSTLTLRTEKLYLFFVLGSFLIESIVDPISNRFYLIANALGVLSLFLLYRDNSNKGFLKREMQIYLPVFLLHVLIIFRADWPTFDFLFFVSNSLFAVLLST